MAKLDIECCPICCAPVKAIETCNSVRFEYDGPRWISVEERLPGDDCDWVLAIGKFVPENIYGKPIISELRKDGKWWGDISDEFPLEDMGIRITHWMPLPPMPEEVCP